MKEKKISLKYCDIHSQMDHIFHVFNEVFTILKYIHSQKSLCKLCAVLRDESLYLTVIDFIT